MLDTEQEPEYELRTPLIPPSKQRWLPGKLSIVGLLLFVGFWIGMVIVGSFAFAQGSSGKALKPIDMFGFSCGAENTWNGTTVDLTDQPFLYVLEPFQLVEQQNLPSTFSVCLPACPSDSDLCNVYHQPCHENAQYRCPYYRLSGPYLYDHLQYPEPWGADWYGAVATFDGTSCPATIPSALCNGNGLQQLSQVPGEGPCYAVWALTRPWNNMCVPIFPQPIQAAIQAYMRSHPAVRGSAGGLAGLTAPQRIRVWVSDCVHGKWLLAVSGLLAPLVFALAALLLLHLLPHLAVWLAIIACCAFAVADALLCLAKAGHLGSSEEVGQELDDLLPSALDPSINDRRAFLALAIVLFVVAGVVALLAILMRHQIRAVGRCLKVVAKAVSARSGLYLMVIPVFLAYVGLVVWWTFTTLYLFSTGSVKPKYGSPSQAQPVQPSQVFNATINPALPPGANISLPTTPSGPFYTSADFSDPTQKCAYDPNCTFEVDFSERFEGVFLYNYFGYWLGAEFLTAVVLVMTTFALQHLYFPGVGSNAPAPMSYKACAMCTLRALPSLITGMFLNALVNWFITIRPLLEILDSFVSRPLSQFRPQGACMKLVMFPVWVVIRALENVCAYLDPSGYIVAALHNIPYGRGCRRAWALNARIAYSLDRVNGASVICIQLVKLSVALCAMLLALGWSMSAYYSNRWTHPGTYLSNPLLIVLYSGISAYLVADIWLRVVDSALRLMLLSYSDQTLRKPGKLDTSAGRNGVTDTNLWDLDGPDVKRVTCVLIARLLGPRSKFCKSDTYR
ncbi:hypothetical protein WJX72_011266 [[Myrmecia] bisecta]|uniref:Choline transporter-like protein n=1 Tax=[Myrmecia] bisecta TaxID=41462 RepID=A0AAW1Q367_9CHLO